MKIELNDYYSAKDAAARLSQNAGRTITIDYPRTLAKYGTVRFVRLSERNYMYLKEDIDVYIVEPRGAKSGRASQERAGK